MGGEAAGLVEGVTPYTLRHSGISWALAAGVPTSDVAGFGGTSVTMLETTYRTCSKTSADAARLRLDAFAAYSKQEETSALAGHSPESGCWHRAGWSNPLRYR